MAALPSRFSVLRARLNATTKSGDSRLITVSLHVAYVRQPLRALLELEATKNGFRELCLSFSPPSIQDREKSGYCRQVGGRITAPRSTARSVVAVHI